MQFGFNLLFVKHTIFVLPIQNVDTTVYIFCVDPDTLWAKYLIIILTDYVLSHKHVSNGQERG